MRRKRSFTYFISMLTVGGILAEARGEIIDIPQANVIGVGCVDMETDYVPHVVTCENGAASFEALKAQAVAPRTFAYYKLLSDGFITDGTGDQVYTCGFLPQAQHIAAAADTECEILTYLGTEVCDVIASFYVAGALTSYTGVSPTFMIIGSDATNTERFVTYNFGLSGGDIEQTTLGFTTPDPLDFTDNRGCMS